MSETTEGRDAESGLQTRQKNVGVSRPLRIPIRHELGHIASVVSVLIFFCSALGSRRPSRLNGSLPDARAKGFRSRELRFGAHAVTSQESTRAVVLG